MQRAQVSGEDSMQHDHHLRKAAQLTAALAGLVGFVASPAFGQNIIDQWSQAQVPPPPELKKVTIEPKSTALLVMGFVRDSCMPSAARAVLRRSLTSRSCLRRRARTVSW